MNKPTRSDHLTALVREAQKDLERIDKGKSPIDYACAQERLECRQNDLQDHEGWTGDPIGEYHD